ncbi:MAG: M48 family metallopeptidase [Acetatifactor sp.]
MRKKKRDIFEGRKVYELTEEENTAVITKEVAEACRHRLEKRWYRRLVEINFLMIIVVVVMLVVNMENNTALAEQAVEQFQEEFREVMSDATVADEETDETADGGGAEAVGEAGGNTDGKSDEKDSRVKLTVEDIPLEVKGLFYGIALLIVVYLGLYYYYAAYRANSLRITEKNFTEIYALIEDYARRLGIKTPKAYVMQQNGVLNAFSAFLFRKQWICIHTELFEVAYREHKDMDALSFVIAHEMAHIYYGHATLHYNLLIWFSRLIPPFSAIASRAREYSCDRLAQRLTGTDGLDAMLVLVVDRHLYKLVDKEDYVEEMRKQKGFFIWVVNMFADHPLMCKRVAALADGKGSGKLY